MKNNLLELPDEFEDSKADITALCKKISGDLKIKNNREKKNIRLNKQVYLGPEFKELWERIKYKTIYSVNFDSQVLIRRCCSEMRKNLKVTTPKLIYKKANVEVSSGGVEAVETEHTAILAAEVKEPLPDVLPTSKNKTNLTRRTIVEILVRSKTLELFKRNPKIHGTSCANHIYTDAVDDC